MFDLSGRCALVTGASGGIGGAVVRSLHARGATVMLSGTRLQALQELAAKCKGRVHVAVADLSETGAVESLVAAMTKAMGSVDILVNNAGLTRDALALRLKDEDWNAVLRVNLTAPFQLVRACLRSMFKKRFGRIVSVTSVVGATGNGGQANYAASKAGLVGMSKSIAAEAATRGVTVNCVAPGFIKTGMTDGLAEARKNALTQHIPMGRMGNPDDVAAAVTYLASVEAGYVTGQTLHVNGGMAMF